MKTADKQGRRHHGQDFMLAPPLAAVCVGGILGAAGQLGGPLAMAASLVVLGVAIVEAVRRFFADLRRDSGNGLYQLGVAGAMPHLETAAIDSHADALTHAVVCAQRAEDDAAARYGFARCAPEDVIRARSIRVQAEIALMRHRVTQLQHEYQR